MSTYRLVIIEDQRMFRSMLSRVIERNNQFALVGEAHNGAEGLEVCRQTRPDLVLLDLQLPDIDGIELGQKLMSELSETGVLALTSRTDSYTTNTVYESGFHGYVEKDQSLEVLQDAMLTVAERGLYFTQLVRDNRFKLQSDPNAFYKIVSEREIEVLKWVAAGMTSQEIGETMNISQRTVENHKYRIMKKVGVQNATALMKYALKLGLSGEIAVT